MTHGSILSLTIYIFYPNLHAPWMIYKPINPYHHHPPHINYLYKVLLVLASLVLAASALVRPRNDLTCSICMDIMQDLDDFITSDTTEQEIVDTIKEVSFTSLNIQYFCICFRFARLLVN